MVLNEPLLPFVKAKLARAHHMRNSQNSMKRPDRQEFCVWSKIQSWLGLQGRAVRPTPRMRVKLSFDDEPLVYAIGDLHGSLDELLIAEARVKYDVQRFGRSALVILLGDLIDRGPHSAQLLDHLVSSAPPEFNRIVICGNHDASFLDFLSRPRAHLAWLDYGGRETLRSYGIDARYVMKSGGINALIEAIRTTIPQEHIDLLSSLPVSVQVDDVLFVHAGIAPGVPLEAQTDEDFMWIRAPFLERGPELPITVVHGHSPVAEPYVGNGRIGIDTGAYATGRLTILRFWRGDPAFI